MDADEDAIREHKLNKVRHHLKELEEKYHHLEKDYAACQRECEEIRHAHSTCHELEDRIKHWES